MTEPSAAEVADAYAEGRRITIEPPRGTVASNVDALTLAGPARSVRMHRDPGAEIVAAEVWAQDCYRLADHAEGRTLVDVGANVGATTLAALAYGATQVVAIDPDPVNFALLEANVAASGVDDLVELHHCAVGPHGRVQVHRSPEHPAGCYGSTWTTPAITETGDVVDQVPLQDLLPTADDLMVKIDTEGAEYDIVDGSDFEILAERVSVIAMEWHHFPERSIDAPLQLPRLMLRLLRRYKIEISGEAHRGGLLFASRR